MSDPLGEYRRKRRAADTPEPEGASTPKGRRAASRFVVQEHSARRLHWDLRLERNGVLVSWALPSGIPLNPDQNAKAVHTEDHPIEYLDFEGEIPAGNYGAGTMKIWDRGTYEAEKFEPEKVVLTFHGERTAGKYAIFRAGKDERDWMIHRMDPAPDWLEPMPDPMAPMKAARGTLPDDERDWAYELEWPGLRALAYVTPGKMSVRDSAGAEVTKKFPEVRALTRALGSTSAILDGVLVVFGDDGRPSRKLAETRLGLTSDSAVRRRSGSSPASFHIFDVPYLDGRDLSGRSYTERRELLESLDLEGAAWLVPAHHRGDGARLLGQIEAIGVDAIIAKRLASAYAEGESEDWRRIEPHN